MFRRGLFHYPAPTHLASSPLFPISSLHTMSLSRSSSAFRIASNPAPGANIVGVRMPPRSPRPSLATTSRRQVAARSYSRAGESSSRRAILGLQVPSRSQDGVHGRTFVSGITTSPGQSQRAHLAPPRLSLTAAQPRHFSSTSSTHAAAQPHTNTPTLLASPSEPEDPDIFSAGPDPSVLLTDRAVAQLHKIAVKEKDEEKRAKLCFRIGVEPGGCHGYQYKMELSRRGQEGKEEEEGDDL